MKPETDSTRMRVAALGPTPQQRRPLLVDWVHAFEIGKNYRDFFTWGFHWLTVTEQRMLLLFVAEAIGQMEKEQE